MSHRKVLTHDFMQILATWSGTAIMVALVLVGILFWHPGYRAWGIVAYGSVLAMLIWMLRGLHERTNAVPGNPVHWVWLGLATYLSIIQCGAQYFPKIIAPSGLNGFISISMIMRFLLLSLGCMLFQEFMSKGQAARWLREISSVAIIMLSLALDALYPLEIPHTSIWLLGCTGVLMAAANAFSSGVSRIIGLSGITRRHQVAIWGQLVIAGLGLLWLLYSGTMKTFVLFLCIVLTVCGFSWVCRRWTSKSPLLYIPVGVAWWLVVMAGCFYCYDSGQSVTFWGHGESSARYFSGIDDGVTVLINFVGLAGTGGMFAGLVAVSMMVIVKKFKSSDSDFWKAVLWLTACWLATAAWTAKKAFFSVAPMPIMMMSWGLLFTFADIEVKWHRAWRFALPMGLGLFWLAIANESTLFQKAAFSFGYNDFSLHKIAGAVFCIFMAWWWARGKWWWAVPAVIVAALTGGAAEVFQKYFSRRSEDMKDWQAHLKGVACLTGMLIFVFAGRAGLKCKYGKIDFASKDWKKYVRVTGIVLQTAVIVAAFCFWFGLICDALPGNAYRDIELITTDYAIASNSGKYGNGFLYPATCNLKLAGGTAQLYGYYNNDKPQKLMFTCWTGVNSNSRYSNLCFYTGNPGESLNELSLLGDPFGPCGYEMRNVLFEIVSPNSKLLLIDTNSVLKWATEDGTVFAKNLQELDSQYRLIFVHPGPWKKYCEDLPQIRELFPDVPVIGRPAEIWDFRQAVQKLGTVMMIHKNHQNIVCLSDNPYFMDIFASGLGDYNCIRSVIIKPNYDLPNDLKTGKRKHLFIKRENVSAVLKELQSGGINR